MGCSSGGQPINISGRSAFSASALAPRARCLARPRYKNRALPYRRRGRMPFDIRPWYTPGSDLLSHAVAHAVPSAVEGLTSVFGMGTGVTLLLWPPGIWNQPTPYTGAARHVVHPRSPGMFSGARATTRRRLNVKEQRQPNTLQRDVPVRNTHAL